MPEPPDKCIRTRVRVLFFGLVEAAKTFGWKIVFLHGCIPQIVSCANSSLLLVLVMALLCMPLKKGSFPRSSEPDPVRAGFCISFVVPITGLAGQGSTAPVLYQQSQ